MGGSKYSAEEPGHSQITAAEIKKAIDDFVNDSENVADLPKFLANSPPLVQHVEKFINGLKHHEKQVVINFLNKENLDVVVDTVLSHSRIAVKARETLIQGQLPSRSVLAAK